MNSMAFWPNHLLQQHADEVARLVAAGVTRELAARRAYQTIRARLSTARTDRPARG